MAKKDVVIIPWEDPKKWLCTFNDLMTLLLTFFVLLLSMSSLDSKSVRDISEQMMNALGVLEAGSYQEETIVERIMRIEDIGKRQKVFKNIKPASDSMEDSEEEADITLPDNLFRDFRVITEEGSEDGGRRDEQYAFNQFQQLLETDLQEPGIVLLKQKRGTVLRLEDAILFEPGQAVLDVHAYPLLDTVAEVAQRTGLDVYVEGHTDSAFRPTKLYDTGWQLSTARAISVVDYLVEQRRLPAERFGVSGYADSRPVASNKTEAGRSKNRRIEIILSRY